MLQVYACLTAQHDLRLVVLAGIICFLACFSAMSLLGRAQNAKAAGSRRATALWIAAASVIAGAGIWATHFVAMLGYRPGLPLGFSHDMTILSIVTPMLISAIGLWLALSGRKESMIGGAIVGVGIGAMHYVGMAAVVVPARLHWDPALVAVSIAIGLVFGVLSLASARHARFTGQLAGAILLTLAIAGLHFTAMAAVSFTPDPAVPMPQSMFDPNWLAISVAVCTSLLVAVGLGSAILDRRVAMRSTREAAHLRDYVAELEKTKKELEQTTFELKRALQLADDANKAKTMFLANMSHELRTPLNAIIGFSELLIHQGFGELGDPHYRDYAQDINDSGQHLLGLINDVLDISKLDAVAVETYQEPANIPDVLHKTVQTMRPQAERAGVTLVEAFDTSLPMMRTDERRLRQVLLNLLSNGVKFTAKGGKISVSAYRQGGGIAISVADTGIGIAPEDIPKAMENFGQVQSGWSRTYEGTGIGLPLSKRLVELMGGTFVLESQVGVGTTIIISFPAERLLQSPQRLVA